MTCIICLERTLAPYYAHTRDCANNTKKVHDVSTGLVSYETWGVPIVIWYFTDSPSGIKGMYSTAGSAYFDLLLHCIKGD